MVSNFDDRIHYEIVREVRFPESVGIVSDNELQDKPNESLETGDDAFNEIRDRLY